MPAADKMLNVKSCPWAPGIFRVAVDPPSAYSAGNVRNEPAAWLNEIVAKAEIKSEIVVLDAAKDRLSHRAHIKLMVTAQPRIGSTTPQRIRPVRNSAPIS